MPGSDPPDPSLPNGVFTALHAMNYDSANMSFKDASGNLIYMFVQRASSGVDVAEWINGTNAAYSTYAQARIPQLTYDVIKNGTYSNGVVTYNSSNYRFRLCRDSNGKQIAQAVVV